MSINITLVVQMIVFALLIWFTMSIVWPFILRALEQRAKRIADGLAAAEKGQKDLSEARAKADEILREARTRAQQIIDQAQHRANELIEQAKNTAVAEGERLIAAAQQQTELEISRAREALRQEVAALALAGAAQLLQREIDPNAHADLLARLAEQVGQAQQQPVKH